MLPGLRNRTILAALALAVCQGPVPAARQAPVVGGAWPQWGGPNRNFVSDSKGLATKWPAGGPKKLWTRALGEGHSAISVDQLFANPYVDPALRGAALTRMVDALSTGDLRVFERDREHFRVTHVLARGDQAAMMAERSRAVLTPVVRFDTMTVFAVHPPTP